MEEYSRSIKRQGSLISFILFLMLMYNLEFKYNVQNYFPWKNIYIYNYCWFRIDLGEIASWVAGQLKPTLLMYANDIRGHHIHLCLPLPSPLRTMLMGLMSGHQSKNWKAKLSCVWFPTSHETPCRQACKHLQTACYHITARRASLARFILGSHAISIR